jgi:hypothetical protein
MTHSVKLPISIHQVHSLKKVFPVLIKFSDFVIMDGWLTVQFSICDRKKNRISKQFIYRQYKV